MDTQRELFDILDSVRGEFDLSSLHHNTSAPVLSAITANVASAYVNDKVNGSVYDPASGVGSMLIEVLRKNQKNITYGFGQDINTEVVELANKLKEKCNLGKTVEFQNGNTIESPGFIDDGKLKEFDLVVSSIPMSIKFRGRAFLETEHSKNCKHGDILFMDHVLHSLKDDGVAIITSSGAFSFSSIYKSFREYLLKNDFIEAIIQLPKRTFLNTSISPCIYILNKNKGPKKHNRLLLINGCDESYVGPDGHKIETINRINNCLRDFNEEEQYSRVIRVEECLNGEIDDLRPEANIDTSRFFHVIKNLSDVYKKYSSLEDISEEIIRGDTLSGKLKSNENSVYIHEVRKKDIHSEISELSAKGNYIQVTLDPEKAINEYVCYFLKTGLGQHYLSRTKTGLPFRVVTSRSMKSLPIQLPEIAEQKKFVENYKRLNNARKLFDEIVENDFQILSDNAKFSESMASLANKTEIMESKSAQSIREAIKHGESTSVEFKESFSMHTKGNLVGEASKDVALSTLKNIVGFLNTERGGKILIGVTDDGKICGIDTELKKLRKGVIDNYLLHLCNNINDRIGTNFSTLIEPKIVEVCGKLVCQIDCSPSHEPCYLNDSDFYLRTGPRSDKLSGSVMYRYCRNRFPMQ